MNFLTVTNEAIENNIDSIDNSRISKDKNKKKIEIKNFYLKIVKKNL